MRGILSGEYHLFGLPFHVKEIVPASSSIPSLKATDKN